MQVFVRDNDINSALRVLKKKMQREGTFRDMKRRRAYEKPSERRVREKADAIRRHRKMRRQLSSARGEFKIVRLLPEEASVFQYRVKSKVDGHERIVREDQLTRS